jgi:hypothetical protein
VNYRGLGFDPTPGSVDAVQAVVSQLRAAVDALEAAEAAVRAATRHASGWQGAAADAFRVRAAVPPKDTARLRAAIPVLEAWAETLAANRRRAEELDARARRLRQELEDARDAVQAKENERDLASSPAAATTAGAAVAMASDRVAALEAELAAVLAEARTLARDHLRAADEAAIALGATPSSNRPAVQALAGVLHRSSRMAAALGALIAPGRYTAPSPGAVTAALSQHGAGTGEMIELNETPR